MSIRILFTFTGSFEGLATLYDIAKSPVGDIAEGGTENDLTDTDTYLREPGSGVGVTDSGGVGVTDSGGAATGGGVHEQAAGQDVPEIVLEDVDKVGEWHTP